MKVVQLVGDLDKLPCFFLNGQIAAHNYRKQKISVAWSMTLAYICFM